MKSQKLALLFAAATVAFVGCKKASSSRNTPSPQLDPTPSPTPESKPSPEPLPSPTPNKFGLHVDPTIESIQANLLNAYCVPCHGGTTPPRNLDLTDLSLFLPPHDPHRDPNGYHGTFVAPGEPSRSMLVIVMKSRRRDQMPPADTGYPLVTESQLRTVEDWIQSLEPEPGSTDEPGNDGGGDDEPGDDGGGDDEPGVD